MCRMCLVEIDTGRGPALQPACMIPVAPGHEGRHRAPTVTKKAQDGVLEFLLINHPLDCPVCDKGGECPLQDQTLRLRPGREPVRRGEAPLREADPDQRPRATSTASAASSATAAPASPTEVAGDPLIHFQRPRQPDRRSTPSPTTRSRRTSAATPCRSARSARSPPTPYRFKARPWDLEQVESHLHDVLGRLPHRRRSRRRNEVAALPGRRHRPGQLGLAVRQGPLRLRGGQQRRPPRPSRWSRDGRRARRGPLVRGARPRPPTAHRRRSTRTGPAGSAVLGGARLTNEAAYAWAKLAKGVSAPTTSTPSSATACPPSVVLGLPRPRSTTPAPRAARSSCSAPTSRRSCRSCSCGCATRSSSDGVTVVELAPAATGLDRATPPRRCATGRARPAEVARRAARRRPAHRGRRRSPPTWPGAVDAARAGPGHRRRSAGRRWPSRPTASSTPPRASSRPAPSARFLSALRRGNVHGALDMGLAPGLLPGRVTLDDGRALVRDGVGHGAGRAPASTPPASSQAAADGKIDALVLLGADPLADFPDRDLAAPGAGRRPHRHRRRPASSPTRSTQADVVLAGRRLRRGRRHHHQPRGPRQPARPEGHAAGHRPRRLDDRRRAGPPPRRRPRPRVGRRHLGRDRASWRRATPGITARAAPAAGAATASSCPLEPRPATDVTGPDGTRSPTPASRPTADAASGAPTARPRRRRRGRGRRRRRAEADDAERRPRRGADRRPSPSTPPEPRRRRPPVDAYSLRLVATRKLYDRGTLVQHSPSLAGLAAGTALRVQPARPRPPRRRRRRRGAGRRRPRHATPSRSCPTPACRGARPSWRSTSRRRRRRRRSSTRPRRSPTSAWRLCVSVLAARPAVRRRRRPRRSSSSSLIKTVVVVRVPAGRRDAA